MSLDNWIAQKFAFSALPAYMQILKDHARTFLWG